jgi:phage regulator Rha-like protein
MQEIVKSTTQKMSSKQIAEKTGKEHSNVLRDIRNMLFELEKDDSTLNHDSFQVIKDNRGYDSEILLTERLSLCLASGYSISLRMKIIDDWSEMKKAQQNVLVLPHDFVSALKALVVSEEAKQLAEAKVLEQTPKVEAFDRVIDNSTVYTLDTVSDIINVGRNNLSSKLKEIGWAMKDSSKGTSSTRNVEEQGFARTFFETITRGQKEMKVKKIVITKKGLDYIVNNYSRIFS